MIHFLVAYAVPLFILAATTVAAQGRPTTGVSLTGIVRDTTGLVLPGETVELVRRQPPIGRLPLRVRVTVINLFDTVALYNFLSTFSGTHFVTPRTVQAQLVVPF